MIVQRTVQINLVAAAHRSEQVQEHNWFAPYERIEGA